MTERCSGEAPKEAKKCSPWPVIILLAVLVLLAAFSAWEHQQKKEALAEKARVENELGDTKGKLKFCEARPACEKPKLKQVRRPKPHRYAVPKPFMKQKAVVATFDPKVCGVGTDAVIDKATGKPECRPIPVPPPPAPAPVLTRVAEEKPEVKCEKPLIRELRDDGSIACIAPPVGEIARHASAGGCLPPDAYGRIMCRRAEARSGSSWVPWAIGGVILAAVLHDRNHRSSPSLPLPAVVAPPPAVAPGVGLNPGLPGVTLN